MIRVCLKIEKNCKNCRNNIWNKKNPITKQVYENNTMMKTERSPIIGRSGCGKTDLMLSLLKNKNPDDVNIICKTDNQYPSNYHNQSSEVLHFEDYGNKTIVFDDMLGSKEAKDIHYSCFFYSWSPAKSGSILHFSFMV